MRKVKVDVGKPGLNFMGVLALIFVTLKLTSVITWSWWWVLSPIWIPLVILMIILCIIVAVSK